MRGNLTEAEIKARNAKLREQEDARRERKELKAMKLAIPLPEDQLEPQARARAHYMTSKAPAYGRECIELARQATNKAATMRRHMDKVDEYRRETDYYQAIGDEKAMAESLALFRKELKDMVYYGYVVGVLYSEFKVKEREQVTRAHG